MRLFYRYWWINERNVLIIAKFARLKHSFGILFGIADFAEIHGNFFFFKCDDQYQILMQFQQNSVYAIFMEIFISSLKNLWM